MLNHKRTIFVSLKEDLLLRDMSSVIRSVRGLNIRHHFNNRNETHHIDPDSVFIEIKCATIKRSES